MSSSPDSGTVLVAGATGFIGCKLVEALHVRRRIICALARDISKIRSLWPQSDIAGRGGDMANAETLKGVCAGVHTVFHLASHGEEPQPGSGEDLHWRVTVEGTRRLLQEAARAEVKRFIYVSSVKAMGEGGNSCLNETSPAAPLSSYGRAKLEAERLVLETGMKHGMHVCNLRLPPVCGRDNRGNIWRMIAAIDRGRFPPLPETGNRRSMVHVDDVVQALLLATEKSEACNQTYIVTDGQVYSTRRIYELICKALGRPVGRAAIPAILWRAGAKAGDLIGWIRGKPFLFNSEVLDKLLGSAWYSSDKIRRELGFESKHTLETALLEMVAEYHKGREA